MNDKIGEISNERIMTCGKIKRALRSAPRTNEEAKVFQCLDKVAQIAGLYLRAGFSFGDEIEYYYNADYRAVPEPVQKELDKWREFLKDVSCYVGYELIDAISEYNNAVAKVNADNRSREEILKSEGYNSKTKKFE